MLQPTRSEDPTVSSQQETIPEHEVETNVTSNRFLESQRQGLVETAERQYGDLFGRLSLTEEEENEFLRLYADWRTKRREFTRKAMAEIGDLRHMRPNAEERAYINAGCEASEQAYLEGVHGLLGPQFQVYEDYAKTLGYRIEVSQLMQEPMAGYVKDRLVQILAEETQSADLPRIASYLDSQSKVSLRQQRLERRRMRDERVLARTASYLTPEQQTTLTESMQKMRKQEELFIEIELNAL